MKKAVLRTAGTAALGVAVAAAAAGTASAAAPAPLGGLAPLAAGGTLADAGRTVPLAEPVAQALGSLNPGTGTRAISEGVRTVQPTLTGVAYAAGHLAAPAPAAPAPQQQAPRNRAGGGPGGVSVSPSSHGNSFGGPLGQVLGALGGGGSVLGG
ncbi:hypothetical protein [Peterkaempfera bronchialis]|uniref:hypothetical protein n=1 Tax=Peterkaempfera bronchialis TaxID=2126346 RepID=UPI003C2CE76C